MNDTPGNTPTSKKYDYILTHFYLHSGDDIVHYIKAQGVEDARKQQQKFEEHYNMKTTLYLKVE